jgi:hypothetical protein
MNYAQEGWFSSARGLTMVLGGRCVRPALTRLGLTRHLKLGNASGMLSQLIKACARGPRLMYGSLLPAVTGGFTFRTSPLLAEHTKHALAAGMARGQVAAARSNFETVFKVLSPHLFSGVRLDLGLLLYPTESQASKTARQCFSCYGGRGIAHK